MPLGSTAYPPWVAWSVTFYIGRVLTNFVRMSSNERHNAIRLCNHAHCLRVRCRVCTRSRRYSCIQHGAYCLVIVERNRGWTSSLDHPDRVKVWPSAASAKNVLFNRAPTFTLTGMWENTITRSPRCLASSKVRSSHCDCLSPRAPLKGIHLRACFGQWRSSIWQDEVASSWTICVRTSRFNVCFVPPLETLEALEEICLGSVCVRNRNNTGTRVGRKSYVACKSSRM